ncbi:MAG TPA: tetratricopeptide repeat protein [Rhodocyclaceae bacterium]|nr:tetratricopeptide repeat protein [Rhodocyclaceae bacterium]
MMKPKALVTILSVSLAACTATLGDKQAWEARPVLDVRHGMASASANVQLGRYQQEQGNPAAAEAFYQKALAIDPKNVDALNALGRLYAERGDLQRAAATFRRVAELAPQRAYLHNNVGYALYLQGLYAEAVDALRRAVRLLPGYERAWANLEKAALRAGMPEVAALAARHRLAEDRPVAAVEPKAPAGDSGPRPVQLSDIVPQAGDQGAIEAFPAVAAAGPAVTVTPVAGPPAITVRDIPAQAATSGRLGDAAAAAPAVIVFDRESTASPAGSPPDHAATAAAPSPMPKARIEVSNGNGVTGFARRIRSQLENDGVKVARMTNYPSFNVAQTIIEYREGYAWAAQALQDQLGKPAAVSATHGSRPGTDVRVILGRDWPAQTRTADARPGTPRSAKAGTVGGGDV